MTACARAVHGTPAGSAAASRATASDDTTSAAPTAHDHVNPLVSMRSSLESAALPGAYFISGGIPDFRPDPDATPTFS
jgi:hypothetical protein